MNLAFLIGFMTFHFYLNLAFHANISTIKILIVIYFNFWGVPHSYLISSRNIIQREPRNLFFNFNLFDFISLGICHIF